MGASVVISGTWYYMSLATYGLQSGPQGYNPLRAFIAAELIANTRVSAMRRYCELASGSLQAIELVFRPFWTGGAIQCVAARGGFGGAQSALNRPLVSVICRISVNTID